jgi:hypothetical protein
MICAQCGTTNREGELICVNCGILLAKQAPTTIHLPLPMPLSASGLLTRSLEPAGNSTLLTLEASEHVYEIPATNGTSVLMGRNNTALTPAAMSVLDLVEAGGVGLGVSRRHALIWCDDSNFFVKDLDSTNGTYLNGRRLRPREQHLLVSGDVLRLGALEVRVQIS